MSEFAFRVSAKHHRAEMLSASFRCREATDYILLLQLVVFGILAEAEI
jgi:hypothetical protein